MPQLSVIVPAYNERDNLAPLTAALASALDGTDYEVVIVDDDSPDGTGALARRLAQDNPRIRMIQRIGRRGLASAVVEGALSTSSPYIAVMDADLQHDERILPLMLAKLRDEHLDLVVGSRHLADGGMGDLPRDRVTLSNAGRRLFELVSRTRVSDPMSGYFVLTREFFDEVAHSMSAIGFKVLVDILASANRPVRVAEVAYQFRTRAHGASKLDIVVELEYLEQLVDKITGGWIPPSYFLFGLVGTAGMAFNFLAAALLLRGWGMDFLRAQAIGALLTVAFNYFLNNATTFRSARMRGAEIATGLFFFYVVCSVALLRSLPWQVPCRRSAFTGYRRRSSASSSGRSGTTRLLRNSRGGFGEDEQADPSRLDRTQSDADAADLTLDATPRPVEDRPMTRRFSFDLIEVGLALVFLLMVAKYVEYRPAPPPEWHADFEKVYGPKESQFAEEWLTRDFFRDRRAGVFVDAGAADARKGSTTYRLETALGWSGVAIEPQPQYAESFARSRPRTRLVQAFVGDRAGARTTLWIPPRLPGLASFDKANLEKYGLKLEPLDVPTVTLNDVLDQAGITRVDFVSMDIENAEPMALKGFDIHRFRPELLCVEAHPETRQWLLNYFHANNYVVVGKYLPFDSVNLYFAPAARLTR